MPTATQKTTVRQISNIIKRFKFEEMEAAVMPCFPEVSWNAVKTELVESRTKFTASNVARFIEKVLLQRKLQERVLHDRLSTLEVIDISRHDKRRIWYGYVMTGSKKQIGHVTHKELQSSIKEQIKSLDINMDVKIVIYNQVMYISMKATKKKKSNHRRTLPVFFALFMNEKHFFCSRKTVSDFTTIVTASLGFSSSKRLKLMGKDIRSLDRLYRTKLQGAIDANDIEDTHVYKDALPVKKQTGIDFTQEQQRRAHAEQCFGKSPPKLELVVVHTKDQPWPDEELYSKLKNDTVNMTWEFRSPNIASYLTKLIERQIIVTPLPIYISNLMKLGKNELNVRKS